jgi:hypothetical protein
VAAIHGSFSSSSACVMHSSPWGVGVNITSSAVILIEIELQIIPFYMFMSNSVLHIPHILDDG